MIHLLGNKEDRGGTHGAGQGRWIVILDCRGTNCLMDYGLVMVMDIM